MTKTIEEMLKEHNQNLKNISQKSEKMYKRFTLLSISASMFCYEEALRHHLAGHDPNGSKMAVIFGVATSYLAFKSYQNFKYYKTENNKSE